MKFCQKCGKQLLDEAVICPGCGCAVNNNQMGYGAPSSQSMTHSADYPKLLAYKEKAKSVYTMTIVSLVLCLGIGFIFSMIAMFQTKGLEEPSLNLTDPREIAEFEDAKKKVAFAKSWSPIAIVVFACGAIVCAWFGAMA